MAKDRGKSGVPNKHLHARVSFLQQAASHLTLQPATSADAGKQSSDNAENSARTRNDLSITPKIGPNNTSGPKETANEHLEVASTDIQHQPFNIHPSGGLPLLLTTHLLQVARKSQIRLQPGVKHQLCKRCHTVLLKDITCRKYIENLSKGGRKGRADVLVMECGMCGARKRWPIGASRQRRKEERLDLHGVAKKDDGERNVNEGGSLVWQENSTEKAEDEDILLPES